MPNRTIKSARRTLTGLQEAGLNDYMSRQFEAEIKAAEAEASERALAIIEQTVGTWTNPETGRASLAYDDFKSIEAEARELAKDAGRLSPAEYRQRHDALRSRYEQANRATSEFANAAGYVERIEEDPITFGDDLTANLPSTQPEFSF